MRRGDVVTVAATGDYGKPRPAVIVQTDALPAEHASVVVCQMSSECSDAPDFRVTIDPTESNGLRVRSQVMADKPVTIRRDRIGRQVGHLDDNDIGRLNIALAFVMGLADRRSPFWCPAMQTNPAETRASESAMKIGVSAEKSAATAERRVSVAPMM